MLLGEEGRGSLVEEVGGSGLWDFGVMALDTGALHCIDF